jgi:queuosine precursor transporter
MIALVLYVVCIWAANLTLAYVGVIPIGWGLYAPAGVLWAGLALTLRDLVHDRLGAPYTVAAIAAGAALSWLISPSFALASGAAFLVSELSDLAVYAPIRRRNWLAAIALSNTVGLLVDSVLFLWLAFGSLEFLTGLVVAKVYVTLVTVAVLWFWRDVRDANRAHALRHASYEAAGGYCPCEERRA